MKQISMAVALVLLSAGFAGDIQAQSYSTTTGGSSIFVTPTRNYNSGPAATTTQQQAYQMRNQIIASQPSAVYNSSASSERPSFSTREEFTAWLKKREEERAQRDPTAIGRAAAANVQKKTQEQRLQEARAVYGNEMGKSFDPLTQYISTNGQIINRNDPLNSAALVKTKKWLDQYAYEKNMTVGELINDPKYKNDILGIYNEYQKQIAEEKAKALKAEQDKLAEQRRIESQSAKAATDEMSILLEILKLTLTGKQRYAFELGLQGFSTDEIRQKLAEMDR